MNDLTITGCYDPEGRPTCHTVPFLSIDLIRGSYVVWSTQTHRISFLLAFLSDAGNVFLMAEIFGFLSGSFF